MRFQRLEGPWFHLSEPNAHDVDDRLRVLEPIHAATVSGEFVKRLGQSLEIAVFKGLRGQASLTFFGAFRDLEEHGDDFLYPHDEPPATISGRSVPGKLDFMVLQGGALGGIEIKNTRPWIYPDTSDDIRSRLSTHYSSPGCPLAVHARSRACTLVNFEILEVLGVYPHKEKQGRSDDTCRLSSPPKHL
jgi:hypothetical protein